ncbi:MAG: YeeE/YedE family protein [Sulfitobacter sp.]|nr:YeeE/YedE family protein [Sulfitobacter sp.]
MRLVFALFTGLIFGIGIAFSGMMNPAKVLNFFDLAGTWDPSLAFVMGGALIITFIGYRLVWRRDAPLFGGRFQVPTSTDIDGKLIGGSALFGVGWGIAGFCPGAALPALGTGRWEVVLFIAAVVVGFFLRRLLTPINRSGATA